MTSLSRAGALAAIALGIGFGCKSAPKPNGAENGAQARPGALSRETASRRARQVGRVSYSLWFGLDQAGDESQESFSGRTAIRFELRERAASIGDELTVDFEGGQIRSLSVNGAAQSEAFIRERYDGHRLRLRLSELAQGANRLELGYTHPYSTTGNGLHRAKDPIDAATYLYTNLEPFSANKVFPCFDQPDLKASYEVTVEAPKEWVVVANTLEREVTTLNGRSSWQFPPTPTFSTYVFALMAGPFAVWESEADGIPLRLLARESLRKHVDYREWFDITRAGLAFYNVQFGYPYPYSKYDQILVPDFNAGAMENVGAVTFSERFIYRSRVTADRRLGRALTILHEMAHMWFGNLVTMRWWNGLWLNESFATFISSWAASQALAGKETAVWQKFFGTKQWAYWEDQLVTTHPIEVSVPDTDHAFSNFDGVTYGKGAASLKQLLYLLGEDSFRDGLQRYFERFAHRNTTLADFMNTLSEASGRKLGDWQKAWLQTSGVTGLQADWSCGDRPGGRRVVDRFSLRQTPGDGLRPHRTRVALYRSRGGRLEILDPQKDVLEVEYDRAETPVAAALERPCPDLVFPNHKDQDYAKVSLDERSLKAARSGLARVADPLARQMIWHTLWEMVVDAELRVQDYVDIVIAQAGKEKDTQVLSRILKNGVGGAGQILPPGPQRAAALSRLETFARARLARAPAGGDLQLVWFGAFLSAVESEGGRQYAHDLLEGKARLSGLKVEQDRRWEILKTLARAGGPEVFELIVREIRRDPTDLGKKESISAEARAPDPVVKRKWLDRVFKRTGGGELKNSELEEAMAGFNVRNQEAFTEEMAKAYFSELPALAGRPGEDEEYLSELASGMFPRLCSEDTVRRAAALLSSRSDLPAPVVKALKVARQEEERCVKGRRLALGMSR